MPIAVPQKESRAMNGLEALAYRSFNVPKPEIVLDKSVYPAERDELLCVAETLHKCFHNDPVTEYMLDSVKDVEKRPSLHRRYFQILTNLAYLRGHVHHVHDFSGVILWFPPSVTLSSNPLHLMRAGFFDLLRHSGLEGFKRFATELMPLCEQVKARTLGPKAKCYYIFAMAVLGAYESQNLAFPLMEHVLREADENHLPCLTECCRPELLPLYLDFGFLILDVQYLGKGDQAKKTKIWFLIREPYSSKSTAAHDDHDHHHHLFHSSRSSNKRQSTLVGDGEEIMHIHHHHSDHTPQDAPINGGDHLCDSNRPTATFQAIPTSLSAGISQQLKKRGSLFGLGAIKGWRRSNHSKNRVPSHLRGETSNANLTSGPHPKSGHTSRPSPVTKATPIPYPSQNAHHHTHPQRRGDPEIPVKLEVAIPASLPRVPTHHGDNFALGESADIQRAVPHSLPSPRRGGVYFAQFHDESLGVDLSLPSQLPEGTPTTMVGLADPSYFDSSLEASTLPIPQFATFHHRYDYHFGSSPPQEVDFGPSIETAYQRISFSDAQCGTQPPLAAVDPHHDTIAEDVESDPMTMLPPTGPLPPIPTEPFITTPY